jgi:hypothetical protein
MFCWSMWNAIESIWKKPTQTPTQKSHYTKRQCFNAWYNKTPSFQQQQQQQQPPPPPPPPPLLSLTATPT